MLSDEFRLELMVRPNDLDAIGHVNNAIALEYLEAGRWDWLARQGLVHSRQMIAVVARAEIDYLAEIPRGRIEVATVLESPTREELEADAITFRARFRQRIRLPAAANPVVDAVTTVAFLDAAERRLVSLQDFLAAAVPD